MSRYRLRRIAWLEQGVPQPFAPRFAVTLMRVEYQPGAFATTRFAVTLMRVEYQPGAVATTRYAPGNPWALAAALLVSIGVVLMWRRLL